MIDTNPGEVDLVRTVLFLSLFGVVYSYAVYPLILMCLPKRVKHSAVGVVTAPRVSLIIACRNEARRIADKIQNSLAVTYRPLEIIVASDASDDASDSIVGTYADQGVRLVRSPERRGKEHAQGLAVQSATGDILVFTDAGTSLPADAIDRIVTAFTDPRVGAVSSEDRFISADGKLAGEGAYVRYEMWLRRLETRVNSLVGLSGSFFAIRRQVAERWDDAIPSDFACALAARRLGLVSVADPGVVGLYQDIKDPSKEFPRKLRTAVRGMTALAARAEVLNPLRFGLFAFQVWSHKVMRWAVPWFLVAALLANIALARHDQFEWLLALQIAGYAVVVLVHFFAVLRQNALLRIGYFFIQANVAVALAALQVLRGRRIVTWDPSVR